jgi:Fe-S cluster assembly protein SufD
MSTTLATGAIESYAIAFERLRGELPGGGRVADLRRQAMDTFAASGFPDVRQEEWRFTDVSPIAATEFDLEPRAGILRGADIEPFSYADCYRLVLANGRLVPELCELSGLPEGVVIGGLAETLNERPQLAEVELGRHAG